MAVSRRDYEALADIIKRSTQPMKSKKGETLAVLKSKLVSELSAYFVRTSSEFNHQKFYDACYDQTGES